MIGGDGDPSWCTAVVLRADDPVLAQLQSDSSIEITDGAAHQQQVLREMRRPPPEDVLAEPIRWVYYPWRRAAASILGPRGFRRVRLDRNRNLITAAEQKKLGGLTVGVVGLSVGHTIAYALAAQGLCGALRLSDFDDMDLTNLNRVPASVLDIGVNKAVVCARRIAELDPYLPVRVDVAGVNERTVHEFLDGVDLVIEECDSLDAKLLVREAARERGIPVLMTTSDRALLDVERFDVDPARPILHGLVGDMDAAGLANLSSTDKLPYSLRLAEASQVSARMAASLIEVGQTLSTWPQLTSEVALNTSLVAEAVRRIGLGEHLPSGRARMDIAEVFDRLDAPVVPVGDHPVDHPVDDPAEDRPHRATDAIAAAAQRAPSGGNAQPWRIEVTAGSVTVALDPRFTTTMDVGLRASALAIGAATFNARVAAAAHQMTAQVHYGAGDEASPLVATVHLAPGDDPELASLYEPMLARETNRRLGNAAPIPADTIATLIAAAEAEGARLRVLTDRPDLESAAAILAAADRIRYLTPRLHAEMFAELRWPDSASLESGIDVRTLELAPADLVMLDVLRRPEVMGHVRAWDGGRVLGEDTARRVLDCAGLAVISVGGHRLADYAHAGAAVESVWIRAQQHGLAVQPLSPPFLYVLDEQDRRRVSPAFADDLARLQYDFRQLVGTGTAESQALILRFTYAARPSVRSRRRSHYRRDNADGVREG
ncbi:dinucleotide-utilizing enzyme possibly involved in molybdopterin or thiamin biosynthesis [Mycolicibacterium flavescens]|uniref:Rv1355c family protein n=1 Tax=Mycobacterium neumannii TaxID=2048551 RepID=UPI000B944ADC|nr:Rv1355c family protein [Mycobacterium neumannii]VEG43775.1 dinucleotide-utilizing enzyme possibly involved in molybdopterin or thiamin biosynthesis [Mycolicibacterium flavescens]